MDKKWKKSIFQLLPLNGRYFLTVALKCRGTIQRAWQNYLLFSGSLLLLPTISYIVKVSISINHPTPPPPINDDVLFFYFVTRGVRLS